LRSVADRVTSASLQEDRPLGFFDIFMNDEKKIKKHHRRLTNRDAQDEDREASAHWLADNGTPPALLALLSRFDMALDHQLKDATEKDLIQSLVRHKGTDASTAVRQWLRQCKVTARPLTLLSDIEGPAAALDVAYELLIIEREQDPFKPEKKKKLLIWLAERTDSRSVESADFYCLDFDEGVRYAAAEVLISEASEQARQALERLFSNPEEDSNRLKVRVMDVFISRRWTLDTPQAVTELPEGYSVQGSRFARVNG
jgi:hypothetical protein